MSEVQGDPMKHQDRAEAVLTVALIECLRNHTAASGALIRKRMKSCLRTALAMCEEDATDIYERIDKARKQ